MSGQEQQAIVVGVFEDRNAVAQALNALLQAGFKEEQLGFATRQETVSPTTLHPGPVLEQEKQAEKSENEQKHGPGAITRGIVGGLMGAIDMLLAPVTGPSDATNILATSLPATEEIIERFSSSRSSHTSHKLHSPATGSTSTNSTTDDHNPISSQAVSSGTTEKTEAMVEKDSPAAREEYRESERKSIVTGGVIGGILGTAAGALFLPELGILVAGGLAAIFGGIAIGSIAGGFLGAFTDLGIPHRKAKYYATEIQAGKTVVTIQTNQRQEEAMAILRSHGAHDVEAH